MGRPKSDVWQYFDKKQEHAPNRKSESSAKCKFCGFVFEFPNATRLYTHLTTMCKRCPPDIKQRITTRPTANFGKQGSSLSKDSGSISSPSGSTSSAAENSQPALGTDSPSATPVPKRRNVSTMPVSSFVDRISDTEQVNIDAALAKAMYHSGCPLSMLNTPYWQRVFFLLRPSYKIPSNHRFGGDLLDSEYEEAQALGRKLIDEALSVSIASDGWTNLRGEGIVNFMVCTPEPVFFKAIETGENRETAEYIAEEMIKVIEEVGPQKVLLLAADNAANMQNALEIVNQKYPHIATVGCIAHSLNLLFGDFLKLSLISKVVQRVRSVIKYVKHTRVVLAHFTKKQTELFQQNAVTLKLPSKTRFSGAAIMLDSLVVNKEALQQTVVVGELNVDKKIRSTVLDEDSFWPKATACLKVLQPIADAILKIEGDDALLSDVTEIFHDLSKHVLKAVNSSAALRKIQEDANEIISKRKEFSFRPVHFAANLLDPRRRGEHLTKDERLAAVDFINTLSSHLNLDGSKVMANLAEFRMDSGLWSRQSVRDAAQTIKPHVWWAGMCAGEELTPVASRLLRLAPHSISCERTWSSYGQIHSKTRNRLKNKKVQKLVAVQMSLRTRSGEMTKRTSKRKIRADLSETEQEYSYESEEDESYSSEEGNWEEAEDSTSDESDAAESLEDGGEEENEDGNNEASNRNKKKCPKNLRRSKRFNNGK